MSENKCKEYIEVIAYTSIGGGHFRAFEVESCFTPAYFINTTDMKYILKELKIPSDMIFDNIHIHKAGHISPRFGLDKDSMVLKMSTDKDEVVHMLVKKAYGYDCC